MAAGMQSKFSSETTARVLITNTWDNFDHVRWSVALGFPSTKGVGIGCRTFVPKSHQRPLGSSWLSCLPLAPGSDLQKERLIYQIYRSNKGHGKLLVIGSKGLQ
jgi:hypothetical protein